MVKSQALRLVPAWNVSILSQAFTSASWTRSSARSALPLSEIAKALKLGIAATSALFIASECFFAAVTIYASLRLLPPSAACQAAATVYQVPAVGSAHNRMLGPCDRPHP